MKRWRYLTIVGVLMCFTALCWVCVPGTDNPKYDGKRLSVWLEGFDSDKQQEKEVAAAALRQMNTNALPLLLQQRGAYDSPLKLTFLRLARRQSLIKIHSVPAAVRQERARNGLLALRPVAKDLTPMLIAIYEQSGERSSKIHPFLTRLGGFEEVNRANACGSGQAFARSSLQEGFGREVWDR